MSKKIFIVICLLLALVPSVLAENIVASPELTTDHQISASPTQFRGIMVITDGTNAVTINIYDSLTATGRKLLPEWVVTTSSTDRSQAVILPYAVSANVGIYVDVTLSAGVVKYMVWTGK